MPPHNKIEVACKNCGKAILRQKSKLNSDGRNYCSRACGAIGRITSTEVPCLICGKVIIRNQSKLKSGQHTYCSYECMGKDREGKATRNRIRIESSCSACGVTLSVTPSTLSRSKQHYCSVACRNAQYVKIEVACTQCRKTVLRNLSQVKTRANHFCDKICFNKWKGRDSDHYVVTCVCKQCGSDFVTSRWFSEHGKATFCSRKCSGAWSSEHVIGSAHPQWNGGTLTYYGPNWKSQRRKALKRDNYRCRQCNASRNKIGNNPHVHHIIPFKKFGYIPDKNDNYLQANELSNLICLCPTCHKNAEWGKIPIQPNLL